MDYTGESSALKPGRHMFGRRVGIPTSGRAAPASAFARGCFVSPTDAVSAVTHYLSAGLGRVPILDLRVRARLS
jgi:hypothetical protein